MRVTWVIVIGVLAGIVGVVAGLLYGARFGLGMFDSLHSQTNLYGAVASMRRATLALDALNANDTSRAKDMLELTLDSALVDFGNYAEALPYRSCEPKVIEAIAHARAYRAAHAGPMQATSAKGA